MKRSVFSRRRGQKALAGGTVATLAALLSGLAAGPAGAATAPAVVTARTTAAVYLSDAASTLVPVKTLHLAAGSWTVSSDVTAINFGGGDFVRCQLQEDGVLIDGGATEFLANRVADLTDVGTFTSTKAEPVSLLCDHDHAAATHNQFYLDAGATITAAMGGPIKSPGVTPASAPTVIQTRTSASRSLLTGTYTKVASVYLKPGRWALTLNATAVNFGDTDSTACELQGSTGSLGTATAVTDGSDAAAAALVVDTAVTVPAGGYSVGLYCINGTTNVPYLDAGATITATKAAPAAVVSAQSSPVALSDQGGVSTIVFKETLPAGAWRVRSAELIVYTGSTGERDFMRCSLRAGNTAIDGGATAQSTPNVQAVTVVNAGSFTATASWTLTLQCDHDQLNTGNGTWEANYGSINAVEQGPIT